MHSNINTILPLLCPLPPSLSLSLSQRIGSVTPDEPPVQRILYRQPDSPVSCLCISSVRCTSLLYYALHFPLMFSSILFLSSFFFFSYSLPSFSPTHFPLFLPLISFFSSSLYICSFSPFISSSSSSSSSSISLIIVCLPLLPLRKCWRLRFLI